MRRVVDVIALMLSIGVLVGIWLHAARDSSVAGNTEHTAAELDRFQRQIDLRGTTSMDAIEYPGTIDPGWFGADRPRNTLLSLDRPWVEVASPEQWHQMHPSNRVALDRTQASFWYNPHQGVIRARVPAMISDEETLDLYNKVNGSRLPSLYFIELPPRGEEEEVELPEEGEAGETGAEGAG